MIDEIDDKGPIIDDENLPIVQPTKYIRHRNGVMDPERGIAAFPHVLTTDLIFDSRGILKN